MAEAVMRDLLMKRGLSEQITVDSAGTSNWHVGEPPHKGTQAKLAEYGIATTGMQCRQLKIGDFADFDYIVGMDISNVDNIRKMLKQPNDAKIFRFLDLTAHQKDVPDPWYTGDFQETYNLCLEGCEALLEKVLADMQKS